MTFQLNVRIICFAVYLFVDIETDRRDLVTVKMPLK